MVSFLTLVWQHQALIGVGSKRKFYRKAGMAFQHSFSSISSTSNLGQSHLQFRCLIFQAEVLHRDSRRCPDRVRSEYRRVSKVSFDARELHSGCRPNPERKALPVRIEENSGWTRRVVDRQPAALSYLIVPQTSSSGRRHTVRISPKISACRLNVKYEWAGAGQPVRESPHDRESSPAIFTLSSVTTHPTSC